MIRCRAKVRIDLRQNHRIKDHSKRTYSMDKEHIRMLMVPNTQDNGKTTKCMVKENTWMVQESYGQGFFLMDCMIQAKLMYLYDPSHLVYNDKTKKVDKENSTFYFSSISKRSRRRGLQKVLLLFVTDVWSFLSN